MIWRRLLVRSNSSIADFHSTLHLAMDWADTHRYRFRICGQDYGISRLSGIGFGDESHQVRLAASGFCNSSASLAGSFLEQPGALPHVRLVQDLRNGHLAGGCRGNG